ncbi:Fur family transcriptional regulator [Mesoplasma lactucae]|uniref:Fur family transcriptional regulator n=1 Tax=Mesoplasma lactucae ATCC 49193 TaxID=81460 RepID=A0A291IRY8_9MOLU|nr:transcriptional repressor [Mesoplasma lactucae]ATG97569.1 Fur family transcriptional regulator [Mesoplasma lactucae ATCC 49193]ATZ19972.1 Fur family transcriptional regulator [Mesoplasma lactucae ATCC 49193]MCL8217077.1 Peroxide operon regulator [Mesoplasma lactucae ATCC 49193]
MKRHLTEEQQAAYDSIIQVLKDKGIKITKVRESIIEMLLMNEHATTSEIVKSLKDELDNVNTASVYNTLDLLLAEHIVSANTFNGKQICYEIVERNTIHFSCIKCDRVYHIRSDEIEEKSFKDLEKLGDSIGFKMDHFKIECHGTCQSCLLKEHKQERKGAKA